jgi:hypothetical protein
VLTRGVTTLVVHLTILPDAPPDAVLDAMFEGFARRFPSAKPTRLTVTPEVFRKLWKALYGDSPAVIGPRWRPGQQQRHGYYRHVPVEVKEDMADDAELELEVAIAELAN